MTSAPPPPRRRPGPAADQLAQWYGLVVAGGVFVLVVVVIAAAGMIVAASNHHRDPVEDSPSTLPPWPFPTLGPSPQRTPRPDLPLKHAKVAAHHPARITGTRPLQVQYRITGPEQTVVALDCSRCRGRVYFTTQGRRSPWIDSLKPRSGAFMDDIDADLRTNVLVVEATGRWTATITSLRDVATARPGVYRGHDSEVVRLPGPGGHLRVRRVHSERRVDTLWGRLVPDSTRQIQTVFGDEAADPHYDQTVEAQFPTVVAISTRGEWELIPEP